MVIRRFVRAAALVALVLPLAAPAAARNYTVTSFDKIRVDGPFRVLLRTSVSPFAQAEGSQSALDSVAVEVHGRTLVIRPNRSAWGGFPGRPTDPVVIEVGTHELVAAWLNGAGGLAIDRVRAMNFDLSVQGAGAASIGEIEVDRLAVGLAGAASATLAGKVQRLTAIIRGASAFNSTELEAKTVKLGAEGPALVRVRATKTIDLNAAGTASITVEGEPACTVKAAGSVSLTGCR